MVTLVLGGASSGKSSIGEDLCTNFSSNNMLYIATMMPYGSEAIARIKKHQISREAKGFETMEVFHDVEKIPFNKKYDSIILECLSNLLANEIFENKTSLDDVSEKIILGLKYISKYTNNLVVVSNDVFSDTLDYEKSVMEYIELLGSINTQTAHMSDTVIEAVFGIKIIHKEGPCLEKNY